MQDHSRRNLGWLASTFAMPVLCAGWATGQTRPAVEPDDARPSYEFRFGRSPGRTTYYVIENEFKDSAKISGEYVLGYSNAVFEKRTIKQTQRPPTTNRAEAEPEPMSVEWFCDRYEARQGGSYIKKAKFDSLKHTYPVVQLRELAQVPQSTVTFVLDPLTGVASSVVARPGPARGPPTKERLCDTARRCLVNRENAERILFVFGELYFPKEPKRVGDSWTITYRTNHKNYGMLRTELKCTLGAVRDEDSSQIATIQLIGKVTLEGGAAVARAGEPEPSAASRPVVPAQSDTATRPTSQAATTRSVTPTTTRPTSRETASARVPPRPTPPRRARANDPPRTLDRAVCRGTVRFDLTNGELVEMTLRRELEFGRELRAKNKPEQRSSHARQTESHKIRIRRHLTPPPQPVIAGGPKPPPEPKQAASPRPFTLDGKRPSTPGPRRRTTQPARTPRPVAGRATTRRARPVYNDGRRVKTSGRIPASPPRRPTKGRPATRPPRKNQGTPTSRPSMRPALRPIRPPAARPTSRPQSRPTS